MPRSQLSLQYVDSFLDSRQNLFCFSQDGEITKDLPKKKASLSLGFSSSPGGLAPEFLGYSKQSL